MQEKGKIDNKNSDTLHHISVSQTTIMRKFASCFQFQIEKKKCVDNIDRIQELSCSTSQL